MFAEHAPFPARPAPLRTDGRNAFAHHSMAVRVPGILRETLARNPDFSPSIRAAVERLHDEVAGNAPIRLFEAPAPDYDVWAALFPPHAGETWLNAEWFFSEMLVYRRLLEATRYWTTLRDPFAPFKEEERASAALWNVLADALGTTGSLEERLTARFFFTLWGNRIDLSLKSSAEKGTHAHADHLLADEVGQAVARLLAGPPGEVHLVLDNAGTEEAMDLALADVLLETNLARTVTLHVKMHPVLVSDVIVADVHRMLTVMAGRGGEAAALSARLQSALDAGRLSVVPDFFWNTAGRLWELPPRLERTFRRAALVVTKGDINYRRATNDALWPPEATLADALPDFPAPLLALRTLKSDTLVGVPPAVHARLDAAEPDWRTNGAYGVGQFIPGT